MSKPHTKELDRAMRGLQTLIDLTHEIMVHYTKRGDPQAAAKLIFEQRHNFKVLFNRLERAKK